ncbi:MAG: flagellar motor protein MotB [Schwartzia succinivorans]|jgi:chemotaxis protein MotB|nr:flagellar motor protein MotB [Schwartzia succinivorans]
MSKKKKHGPPHEEEAGEAWLLPYSDLMTLLLALFLCLFCMSKVDGGKAKQMGAAFGRAFNLGSGGMGLSILPGFGPAAYPQSHGGTGSGDGNGVGTGDGNGTGSGDGVDHGNRAYLAENETLEHLQQTMDQYIATNHLKDSLRTTLTEEGLMIRIRETALFPSGSAELVNESQLIVPVVAGLLAAIPERVIISGHTDNVPIATEQYPSNWELSSARAMTFMKALFASNATLNPARFSAIGYSEYRPVAPNETEEGRRRNRRVEIMIARSYKMAEGTIVAR